MLRLLYIDSSHYNLLFVFSKFIGWNFVSNVVVFRFGALGVDNDTEAFMKGSSESSLTLPPRKNSPDAELDNISILSF